MLSEKENSILEKAEDAILKRIDEYLRSDEPTTEAAFQSVLDGVRITDRICRMKYGQIPILTNPEAVQQLLQGNPNPGNL